MAESSVFEFSDPGLSTPPETFGPWSVAPAPASGFVSFDAASPPQLDGMVWRVNLSADPNVAAGQLQQAEAQIQASQAALSAVPGRLDKLVEHVQREGGMVSFGVPGEMELAQPEAELLQWLEASQSAQVSFGLTDVFGDAGEQAREQLRVMTEQMTRLMAYAAWVETRVEAHLLARTVVGWGGDADTLWRVDAQPDQRQLHSRTLALALASRTLWLKTIITVAQGALKISLLLTTPGGAVLAVPVAWKFVNQVLAGFGQHRELAQQLK
ncbi:MAG: hypothetical protein ACRDH2_15235 [Anaerolineales bacterium]